MKDWKKNRWIILLILLLVVIGIIFVSRGPKDNSLDTNGKISDQETGVESDEADEAASTEAAGPITFEIISPEGEVFDKGQARMWKAKLSNFQSEYGVMANCDWKFYLNENNDEVLYKEQAVRSVLSTGGDNSCAFTSTFIEKRGVLRAVVKLETTTTSGEVIDSYTAERKYIVD